MRKINLKDAYFLVPLHRVFQKFLKFNWNSSIYQFLCLWFELGPPSRVFTKLSESSNFPVEEIECTSDSLTVSSKEEMTLAKDILIYLSQSIGFLININKFVLQPTQKIELLITKTDSVGMTLKLTKVKKNQIAT